MKKKRVVDVVTEALSHFLKEEKYELVDVEFVKEGPYRYLRVTIDNDEPITTDDCQKVSQYLSNYLDKVDPIEEEYFLEITSPGVERVLKKESEFTKYSGKLVDVSFYKPYNGQKLIRAELKGLKDDSILLIKDGEEIALSKELVSTTKLVYEFKEES